LILARASLTATSLTAADDWASAGSIAAGNKGRSLRTHWRRARTEPAERAVIEICGASPAGCSEDGSSSSKPDAMHDVIIAAHAHRCVMSFTRLWVSENTGAVLGVSEKF
jgi:hypothetical protein